jgi:hypothetical protein
MTDKTKVKVLKQHVFHDGTSMIVLKEGSAEVENRFIASLVENYVIEKPKGFQTTSEIAEVAEKATAQDGVAPVPDTTEAP